VKMAVSNRVKFMVVAVWLAAAGLAAYWWWRYPVLDAGAWAFVLLTGMLANLSPVRTTHWGIVSMSGAPNFAGLLLVGPGGAAAAATLTWLATRWAQGEGRGSDLLSWFRPGCTCLALGAAGLACEYFGLTPPLAEISSLPTTCWAVVLALLLLVGTEIMVRAAAWWVRYSVNPFRVMTKFLVQRAPRELLVGSMGLLLTAIYGQARFQLAGLALFIVFFLLVIYANRLYVDIREVHWSTLTALMNAVEGQSLDAPGHGQRVARYVLALSRKLLLADWEAERFYYCALLHDVGWIGRPEGIADKPGPLTVSEYAGAVEHALVGASIVREIPFLRGLADVIRLSHARFDGTGWPPGVKEKEIPLAARMIAVADAFDSMLRARPYRPPLTRRQAEAELIRGSGRQFDPQLVAVFREVIREEERAPDVFAGHYALHPGW